MENEDNCTFKRLNHTQLFLSRYIYQKSFCRKSSWINETHATLLFITIESKTFLNNKLISFPNSIQCCQFQLSFCTNYWAFQIWKSKLIHKMDGRESAVIGRGTCCVRIYARAQRFQYFINSYVLMVIRLVFAWLVCMLVFGRTLPLSDARAVHQLRYNCSFVYLFTFYGAKSLNNQFVTLVLHHNTYYEFIL